MRIFKRILHVLKSFFYITIGLFVGGFSFYYIMVLWHYELVVIKIPDITGMNAEEGFKLLKSLGLTPEIKGSGKIIGTYPRPGTHVYKGRKIEIYCSGFNIEKILSRMIGVPKNIVEESLKTLNVDYKITLLKNTNETGVLAYYIKNKTVYLLIGEEKKERFFRVPDLIGTNFNKAKRLLRNLEIPYTTIGKGKKVVDQFPAPGSIYNKPVKLILR